MTNIKKQKPINNYNFNLNLDYQEKPIMTILLLCIHKPDVGFIIMVYLGMYLFLFYLILMKLIVVYNSVYIYTISIIPPEVSYVYLLFINTSNNLVDFFNTTKINISNQIEYIRISNYSL